MDIVHMRMDTVTFHSLYSRYAGDVFRYALSLCKDTAEAEDITSETFVRTWTSEDTLRVDTVKAYLFTIARNIFLHNARISSRRVPVDETLVDHGPAPDVIVAARDALDRVIHAMQGLSEIDRSVLMLRAAEGLTYEEIASATGLSLAAVKVKIFRARLFLKLEAPQ